MKTITINDDATITVDGVEYVPSLPVTVGKPEPELWAPKIGETYWIIGTTGDIGKYTWRDSGAGTPRLNAGNIFPTLKHAEATKRHREAQSVIDRYCYAKGIDTRWKEDVTQWGADITNGNVELKHCTAVCDGSPFWVESEAIAEQIIADCGDEIRTVLLRGWV